ncbi:type II toxin-antitoxin system RelE/ParE family toxin [Pseudomonas granadensis]|nr:type II toxin-antitoxin system RelE/ParE family toxin [Pseudomonas granadensis]MBN6805921.1 type II toxin-antitoxin system RelE/ParE family toxin [Pseudomonas granadensis]MBN6831039.1 type II toxin-antitoxin system RelE/ParE family toxin [Pseudomonas granadensis]MBN6840412.1 type II toxin-antitoxin system RelE/ParE family toxin [Pseudomonas granadensis]MBN6867943.1 type II toxin-antitoxin system RelE/ParE family toxin [Pseudomonas granadensis]
MTYLIQQTATFQAWHRSIRDLQAKVAIARRIDRASTGNLGDAKSVGDGVSEMRLDIGPGYRVYFTIRNGAVIILLAGGDKSSQSADIRRAQKLPRRYDHESGFNQFRHGITAGQRRSHQRIPVSGTRRWR